MEELLNKIENYTGKSSRIAALVNFWTSIDQIIHMTIHSQKIRFQILYIP
jgi:hypothetical protein